MSYSLLNPLRVLSLRETRGDSALLISGVTYVLWGHPYAVIIMTAEVAFVAWLIGRYKVSLVFADAIYWLLIGLPAGYFLYAGALGVSEGALTLALAKQAVNGICNVLLARMIFALIGFYSRDFSITLRELLHLCMVFCMAMPMLILIFIGSREDFAGGEMQIRKDLKINTQNIEQQFQSWIDNRSAGIASVADVTKLGDPAKTQAAMDQLRRGDRNILRLGVLNPSFIVSQYSPISNEQGKSNIGVDFSDRPFVKALREEAKPMLSEVVGARLDSRWLPYQSAS